MVDIRGDVWCFRPDSASTVDSDSGSTSNDDKKARSELSSPTDRQPETYNRSVVRSPETYNRSVVNTQQTTTDL